MADGHLNKCKECAKEDSGKRTVPRICIECGKNFMATSSEVKRRGSGAKVCSRECYYQYQPKMLDRKWHGKRGYGGLHAWITRKLGKANYCQICGLTTGKFEWSNISGLYKEDLLDWQKLCIKCHRNYDKVGTKAWITRRKNLESIIK